MLKISGREYRRMKASISGNRILSLPRRICNWQFTRNVAVMSLGTALAQVANLIMAPVITRLYSPADLGAFGLFISFLSVAAVAVSMRYELGIVSALDEPEAVYLTFASALAPIPLSLLASFLLYGAMRYSLVGFGNLPPAAALWLVPTLCLTGWFSALRYWLLRHERFHYISKMNVVLQASRSGSQAAMAVASTSTGLLAGEFFGRLVITIMTTRKAWKNLIAHLHPFEWRVLGRALRRNRKFPLYSMPSSILDTIALNAPVPMIVQLFGSQAGGHLALVQRVLAVPTALIATSVADAFHSRLALYSRDNPAQTMGFFRRTSLALFLLGLGPMLALLLAGPQLFRFVFGREWGQAGTLAMLSAPWFLAQFVVSPLTRLVFVLSGQELKFVYDFVVLGSMVAAYLFAAHAHLSLNYTVALLSVLNTVAYLTYYIVLYRIVARHAAKYQAGEGDVRDDPVCVVSRI